MTSEQAQRVLIARVRATLWQMWSAHEHDPGQRLPPRQLERLRAAIIDLLALLPPRRP